MKKAPRWYSILLLAVFVFPTAIMGVGGSVSFTPAVLAGSESDGQMPPEEETQDHEVVLADPAMPGDHDLSVPLQHAPLAIKNPDLVSPPPPPDGLLS